MTRRKNKLISILVAIAITVMAPLQLFASISLHNGSLHSGMAHSSTGTVSYKVETSCFTPEQKIKKVTILDCEEKSTCHDDSCTTSTSCPTSSSSVSLLQHSEASVYIQFSFANAPYTALYIPDFTENTLLRPPISF